MLLDGPIITNPEVVAFVVCVVLILYQPFPTFVAVPVPDAIVAVVKSKTRLAPGDVVICINTYLVPLYLT